MYEDFGDPNEHVDTFHLMLQYMNASDDIKCKILPLSFTKAALAWFKDLETASISSWRQVVRVFSARFTTSRLKPKSEEVMREICQGEKETFREYIERFNKCQRQTAVNLTPPTELTSMSTAWPLSFWGIDLMSPFPLVPGQVKYLI